MLRFTLILLLFASTSQAAPHPNIILVMADDQGYGDLGATGNTVIDTPNIDAMAKRSASMSRFYVSPVCTPTRACLMTGRYNYRTRAVDTFRGRAMMEPSEVTIAEVLQESGYATGIFGKWHLGDCYPMRPIDQGFQEALVHKGGILSNSADPIESYGRYTDPILSHNGKPVQSKGYCTDVFFDAALEFVEKQAKAETPFFAYIATNTPHAPFHDVPPKLLAKYRAMKHLSDLIPESMRNVKGLDDLARIAAMIENIDDNMGRLFTKLDALKATDNTIVIFIVDNGPNTIRYVGNMRGMKSNVHEGGIRSPFFIQWPAVLTAGAGNDTLCAHIDVMPTLLDAAAAKAPENMDGRSFLPLLKQEKVVWPDRDLVLQAHRGDVPEAFHNFALITKKWKLLRPSGFWLEHADPKVGFELYDIPADPKEQNNLIDQHPEVAEQLKARYSKWFEDVSSTRSDNYAPPRIVIGNNAETRTVLSAQDLRTSSGKWLIETEGVHTYKVLLLTREPVKKGAEAVLRINGKVVRQSLAADSKTVVFNAVSVPPGNADVQATTAGKVPWHVVFERQ